MPSRAPAYYERPLARDRQHTCSRCVTAGVRSEMSEIAPAIYGHRDCLHAEHRAWIEYIAACTFG